MAVLHPLHRLIFPLSILLLAGLASCNLPAGQEPPGTPAVALTQVVQTALARLTQTATPTLPAASPSPLATTGEPSPTTSTETPSGPAEPTPLCDRAAAGNPIDLSIPDNTPLQPGQLFTKRWALQNTGACVWTDEYAVKFLYGEQMGAPGTIPLVGSTGPGQTAEISIDMIAPLTPGTYRGNWKLLNPANALFGIGPNGSSPIWVQIVVMPPATPTSGPPTFTPAPSPTITPTPAPQASGQVSLVPGDRLDLDTARANPESGVDLLYETNPDGTHVLIPQGSVTLGLYGPTPPGLADCRVLPQDSSPVILENLGSTYLCYRTGQGLPGRALVTNFRNDTFTLSLEVLTWVQP